eukprot:NODE_5081_length_701_cov_15.994774_g4918_i0.p1 GENE.NODE_5081_length_701_cov_15.994774_g4918_i0~~NODE_5081_length_701_cov_15.994774_g4918_i0.p1  ORF type:complete len:202 (-),score=81.51 NODE_5081_length_701_cov_15.994774_g4918_i0:94-651(-)
MDSVFKTLAIVKPDAMEQYPYIREEILQAGFTIVKDRILTVSPTLSAEFHLLHQSPLLDDIVAHLASGPSHVMVLAKANAVVDGQSLARSIKAKFGTSQIHDAIHLSDCREAAKREIRMFFPQISVDAIPPNKEARDFCQTHLKEVLVKGLTELCKAKPEHPTQWLADYLLDNNPRKPKVTEPAA